MTATSSKIVACSLLLHAAAARAQDKVAVVPTQIEEGAQSLVPDLFDDYLLTAVQNAGSFEVIGQEDIAALIGFEKQKDLVNCTDTSCMADIGGALGVDRIVAVRIARLGGDWVATAKLINIRMTRVENRVNEILPGNAKQLLEAVPRLVQRLFATNPPPPPEAETEDVPPPQPQLAVTSAHPGRGSRIVGSILMPLGAAFALLGGIVMQSYDECIGDVAYGSEDSACKTREYRNKGVGFALTLGGLALEGSGAKVRANGAARGRLQLDDARGSPRLYAPAWILTGLALGSAVLGLADEGNGKVSRVTTPLAWGTGIGATAFFFIGGFLWSKDVAPKKDEPAVAAAPLFQVARVAPNETAYLAGVTLSY